MQNAGTTANSNNISNPINNDNPIQNRTLNDFIPKTSS